MVQEILALECGCYNILCPHCIHPVVAELSPYRVRSAELFRDGVIVTFSDGRSALFSANLLYASLSQAQDLTDQSVEGEDQSGNQGDTTGGGTRQ